MQMQEGKIDYYTQQFPTMKEGDSIDKNSDATGKQDFIIY